MLGTLLMVVGYGIAIVGGIWLLVVAFRESLGWGLCSLLLPIVSLVFAITHWDDAKKPFLTNLVGVAVVIVGILLKAGAESPGRV